MLANYSARDRLGLTLPALRARATLEGAGDVVRDPAAVEAPLLRQDTLAVDQTRVHAARIDGDASGDCFTRWAKKGWVFWKIVPTLPSTPISQMRSASRT